MTHDPATGQNTINGAVQANVTFIQVVQDWFRQPRLGLCTASILARPGSNPGSYLLQNEVVLYCQDDRDLKDFRSTFSV